QEHGQSLSMVAHALRRQGAEVTTVTVYRVAAADDPGPMFAMIDLIAERKLDAVTFTSAPAVAALMEAAGSTGRRDDLISAFQADVVASCVGPVTAAAFEMWGVPTIYPDRSRLAAMVKQLETELPSRRSGLSIELLGGHQLLLHGEDVLEHLRGRPLAGRRIVVQEHGQSLSMVAHALRRQGAEVTTVTVYRVAAADDPGPMFAM
ncbi:uroporphyrinogen-III synthase, partial [Nocardioides hankookensis]